MEYIYNKKCDAKVNETIEFLFQVSRSKVSHFSNYFALRSFFSCDNFCVVGILPSLAQNCALASCYSLLSVKKIVDVMDAVDDID